MSAAFDWAKKPLSPELLEGLETETGKHMKGGRVTATPRNPNTHKHMKRMSHRAHPLFYCH